MEMNVSFDPAALTVDFGTREINISTGNPIIRVGNSRELFDITAPNVTLLPVKSGENWKLYTYFCASGAKRTCSMLQYDWEPSNNRVRIVTYFGWLATDQEKLVNGKMKLFSMMSNSLPDITIDHYDSITEAVPEPTNTAYFLWQNVGMGSYNDASRYTRKAIVFYKDNGDVDKVYYSATLEMHRSGTSCTITMHRNELDRSCICETYICRDPLGVSIKGEHIAWSQSAFPFISTVWSGTTGNNTSGVNRCATIAPSQISANHCLRVACRAGDLWFLGEPIYLNAGE